MRFFNVYEAAARSWIEEHPPFGGPGCPDQRAHLLVVGMGQLGRSVVVGAVRNWLALHHAAGELEAAGADGGRRVAEPGKPRPRITLVDREARREREWLLSEFPAIERFCDLTARQTEVESPLFAKADFLFDERDRRDVSSIFVCVDDDALGLGAALKLHDRLAERDPGGVEDVRIVLRLGAYAGLATLLEEGRSASGAPSAAPPSFANLHTFEFAGRSCTREQLLGDTPRERLAKAIHDEFREEQLARGQTPESKPSVAAWDDLRDDYKDSNRRQADHAPVKLGAIGYRMSPTADGTAEPISFSEEQIEMMARLEHDRWTAERLFEGWRLGPNEPDRKLNPYLVPWDQLSEEIKHWDRNTVRELPAFLSKAGYRVEPLDRADPAGETVAA